LLSLGDSCYIFGAEKSLSETKFKKHRTHAVSTKREGGRVHIGKRSLLKACLFIVVATVTMIGASFSAFGESSIVIPVPPEFTPALNKDGSPYSISVANLKEEFRRYNPDLQSFVYNKKLNDVPIIVGDSSWLKQLLGSYQVLLSQAGIKPEADTWDCENYSSLLNALTTVKLWQRGYTKTRPALGWLRVNAHQSWAGIPAEMHSLMFTATIDGIFIMEPQNGSFIKLAEYPNRAFIEEVYLF